MIASGPVWSEVVAVHDNLHSRVVFWLKIVLPLLALAILSTLFLLSRRINTEAALPYSEVDVKELARDHRLTNPDYASVTDDGSAVRINADVAYPKTAENTDATADALVARYDTPNELRIDLSSSTGRIDEAQDLLILRDDVQVQTSTGYVMTTTKLDAALDKTHMVSDAAVAVTGPLGRIDAGRMEMRRIDDKTGDYVLIFNNGVKLVYDPLNRETK